MKPIRHSFIYFCTSCFSISGGLIPVQGLPFSSLVSGSGEPSSGKLSKTTRRKDGLRSRSYCDAGPGGGSNHGKCQCQAIKDQGVVAEKKEHNAHQDRGYAPSVGTPQPVHAIVFPAGVNIQKKQRLRIDHGVDRGKTEVHQQDHDEEENELLSLIMPSMLSRFCPLKVKTV